MAFISVFPFYWMIVSATNTSQEVAMGKMTFGTNLLENYKWTTKYVDLGRSAVNSVIVTCVAVVVVLLISSIAGYSFEIYKSKAKDRVFLIFLACMMIPSLTTMVALYKMMAEWHLINNLLACILPGFVSIWHVFLFRQSSQRFPYELIEAARVDGMGELKIFFTIYVPIMKSTFSTGFIVCFMNVWGTFMWSRLVLLKDEMMTLPLAVNRLVSVNLEPTNFAAVLLGCTVCTLPTLVLFLLMPKAFAIGMSGSVKG